jgi:hypothetical protein
MFDSDRRDRIRAAAVNGAALVLVGVVVAACGSSGSSSPSAKSAVDTVSRDDALQNVIDEIDSGPSWETAEMSAAVNANILGKTGANDGCAVLYNDQAQKIPGFACYLEYSDPSDIQADPTTGMVHLYFNADRNGQHIHPISEAKYSDETIGPTGSLSTNAATTSGASTATTASTAATTTSSASATETAAAETGGSYSGVAPVSSAGPATDQSLCSGVAATVGPHTSCGFAANVVNVVRQAYTATGHYPARVTAHSPATGGTYALSCGTPPLYNGTPGELDCSTGTGGEVTIGLPLPGH